jgi:hypothetical protein
LHTLVKPDNSAEDELVLFPNPASTEFFIMNPFEGEVIVNIYSMQGYHDQQVHYTKGILLINNLALKSGFYVVELVSADGKRKKAKLIVS